MKWNIIIINIPKPIQVCLSFPNLESLWQYYKLFDIFNWLYLYDTSVHSQLLHYNKRSFSSILLMTFSLLLIFLFQFFILIRPLPINFLILLLIECYLITLIIINTKTLNNRFITKLVVRSIRPYHVFKDQRVWLPCSIQY